MVSVLPRSYNQQHVVLQPRPNLQDVDWFNLLSLALVEYDPCKNDLKVVSLHQFEDDIKGGVSHRSCVRFDPEGRCAAMLMYGSHLAVIPFKHTPILYNPTPVTPLTPGLVMLLPHSTYTLPNYNVNFWKTCARE
ncbi:cleavage and polyadenylation specificity factor subunit 1-like [Halichondria panicea]|uniref:cleavage and polyadenylation specificity factor subunit 1-like n=1 Tax=Halichondria panicea TaxID=6063 RepID=UPI00312BB660